MHNPRPPSQMSNRELSSEILRRWGSSERTKFSNWDVLLEASIRMLQLEKKELDFLMGYSNYALMWEKGKAPITTEKTPSKDKRKKGQLIY